MNADIRKSEFLFLICEIRVYLRLICSLRLRVLWLSTFESLLHSRQKFRNRFVNPSLQS